MWALASLLWSSHHPPFHPFSPLPLSPLIHSIWPLFSFFSATLIPGYMYLDSADDDDLCGLWLYGVAYDGGRRSFSVWWCETQLMKLPHWDWGMWDTDGRVGFTQPTVQQSSTRVIVRISLPCRQIIHAARCISLNLAKADSKVAGHCRTTATA